MKKMIAIMMVCGLLATLSACGTQTHSEESMSEATEQQENMETQAESNNSQNSESESEVSQSNATNGQALVAYFAYSENIGDTSDMTVDAIASASVGSTDNTEGNLQVMAQVIENTENADVFRITVQEPYDPVYDVMHDRAIEEIDNEEFPALTDSVENLEQYDIIYLGMPVWSGSLPRPVATFLAENDLSGKTIVPFGINLGSGFGNMINEIEELCPDATLVEGFTISARTANDEVRTEFTQWLEALELN